MQITSTQKKAIDQYYKELETYHDHKITHETAVRSAFQILLATFARSAKGKASQGKRDKVHIFTKKYAGVTYL
jgi:hypothetical protein